MNQNFNWMTLEQAEKEFSQVTPVWFVYKNGEISGCAVPLWNLKQAAVMSSFIRMFPNCRNLYFSNSSIAFKSLVSFQTLVCQALMPLAPSKLEEQSK